MISTQKFNDFERPLPPIDLSREDVSALGSAIICQAIKDWMFIVTGEGHPGKSTHKEIRSFLSQGLGEDLCDFLKLDPQYIIELLEKRTDDYLKHGVKPPRIPYFDYRFNYF